MKIYKIINAIFSVYKENSRVVVKIFGIKMKFKSLKVNQLEDCCCISNLKYYLSQGTYFIHPIGVVINPDVEVGKNCKIYQNVTLGNGKCNPATGRSCPILGDNVIVYANSVVIGGVTIGDNAIIGAGSVVIRDVPANATVVGNPARIVKRDNSFSRQNEL